MAATRRSLSGALRRLLLHLPPTSPRRQNLHTWPSEIAFPFLPRPTLRRFPPSRGSATPTTQQRRHLRIRAESQKSDIQLAYERHQQLSSHLGLLPNRDANPRHHGGSRSRHLRPEWMEPSFPADVRDAYDELALFAHAGQTGKVERVVAWLVDGLGEAPNVAIYSGLIRAQAGNEGSAAMVRSYLREMEEEGVELSNVICHDVLRALGAHPDYLLRNEIMDHMALQWFTISPEGHHDIIAGLLRERQLELALDRIENLGQEGIAVKPWLLDMAVYILLDVGEVDEALRITRHRWNTGDRSMTATFWFTLLDKAGACLHHEACSFVWKRQVEPRYLNPPEGVCLNVLLAASRHGDTTLATDVMRVLGERGTLFTAQHYEVLAETYLSAGELASALATYCIMASARVPLEPTTFGPLATWIAQDPAVAPDSLDILRDLKQRSDRTVPLPLLNAIIAAIARTAGLEPAIAQLAHLPSLLLPDSNETSHVETYDLLLQVCRDERRPDMVALLHTRIRQQGLKPTQTTYARSMETSALVDDVPGVLTYLRGYVGAPAAHQGSSRKLLRRGTGAILRELLGRMENGAEGWEEIGRFVKEFQERGQES